MQKDLDENSYEKRIENIEKGKSYLKSNGFLNQNLIYSKTYKNLSIKGNLKKIFSIHTLCALLIDLKSI